MLELSGDHHLPVKALLHFGFPGILCPQYLDSNPAAETRIDRKPHFRDGTLTA
jgi:hypothetical protein